MPETVKKEDLKKIYENLDRIVDQMPESVLAITGLHAPNFSTSLDNSLNKSGIACSTIGWLNIDPEKRTLSLDDLSRVGGTICNKTPPPRDYPYGNIRHGAIDGRSDGHVVAVAKCADGSHERYHLYAEGGLPPLQTDLPKLTHSLLNELNKKCARAGV